MTAEGGADRVRREWVATVPTAVKASTAFSGDLPESEKVMVMRGARLSGIITGHDKEYWIITEGALDGRALADNLRFVYKGQWQLQGEAAPPKPREVSAPPPVLAPWVARGPSRRRLLAHFKRRLAET
jgi:hypothetical protein